MELDPTSLWIPLTIAAAFLQNVRSALQKALKGRLGTTGATYIRFVYALPLSVLYLAGLAHYSSLTVPAPNGQFAVYCVVGGLAQIAGTGLLVSLFDRRSFAVGTTYSKTETVQTAVFAMVFLGETVSLLAGLGIVISLVGVIAISTARSPEPSEDRAGRWAGRPALVGLGSGAAFGVAAVSYRGASLALGGEGFAMQAAMTLLIVLGFQTVTMSFFMMLKNPAELRECLRTWRVSALVGASGALASAGWFSAMTLQNAAMVRALGQIELVFTLAASAILFKERILRLELGGIALVTLGIVVLVAG